MKGTLNNVGSIYVLQNKGMKGFYKIGITERDIDVHVSELTKVSGIPYPFELVYSYPVGNYKEAERALHQAFDKQRSNKNREFFKIDPADIKPLIEFISKSTTLSVIPSKTKEVKLKSSSNTSIKTSKQLGKSIVEKAREKVLYKRQQRLLHKELFDENLIKGGNPIKSSRQSSRPQISPNNNKALEDGISLSEGNPYRFIPTFNRRR